MQVKLVSIISLKLLPFAPSPISLSQKLTRTKSQQVLFYHWLFWKVLTLHQIKPQLNISSVAAKLIYWLPS